ncbi:MAG: methyltransferase domain-containing protein [Akkermansiaceae bacterium]|nr:methyltransferase domain-containing protein [Verrucomicrobiales bacterium]
MFEATSVAVAWNPGDYAANSASQQAWARELISKLHLQGTERVLDVGCGDGKITAEIASAVPRGAVMGIDSSREMIHFARRKFPPGPISNLQFEIMDARSIRLEQKFDLAFSNAALHWVDDHQAFLRGISGCLRSGARLVVSCGGKGNAQDVFVALRGEMRLKRWRDFFRKLQRAYFFYSPEDYSRWLPRFGFQSGSVRLADKDMAFENRDQFAGWFRTTWLPYTQRVPESAREDFISAVVPRYIARHPLDLQGRVHVRMVRLEIDAVKV